MFMQGLKGAALAGAVSVMVWGCKTRDYNRSEEGGEVNEAFQKGEIIKVLGAFKSRIYDPKLMQAKLDRIPFAETYWPSHLGGFAARWQTSSKSEMRNYTPATRADLVKGKLTKDMLAKLSPAEKYGIYIGDDNFAKRILDRNFASSPSWMGYCNAWAYASLFFDEPKAVDVPVEIEGKSFVIPFGASDVKALLILNAQRVQDSAGSVTGGFAGQCNLSGVCSKGLNPAAIHLYLVEMLGRARRGVIMDLQAGQEKWNYPVFGFEATDVTSTLPSLAQSALTSARAKNPKVQKVALVRNVIQFRAESKPDLQPIGDDGFIRSATLCYALEMNAGSEVLGGAYIPGSSWGAMAGASECNKLQPDYLWFKDSLPFVAEMKPSEKIYNMAK